MRLRDPSALTTTTYAAPPRELRRDTAPDAAVAADDHVIPKLLDRPSSPSFAEGAAQHAAGDPVRDRACDVEEDCHAGDEQQDTEDLGVRSFRLVSRPVNVVVTTAPVERRDPAFAEHRLESDGADDENEQERQDGAEPTRAELHAAIVGRGGQPENSSRTAISSSGSIDTTSEVSRENRG